MVGDEEVGGSAAMTHMPSTSDFYHVSRDVSALGLAHAIRVRLNKVGA
jgi:hypothetical protein